MENATKISWRRCYHILFVCIMPKDADRNLIFVFKHLRFRLPDNQCPQCALCNRDGP